MRNKAGTTVIITRQIPQRMGGGFEVKVDLGGGIVPLFVVPVIEAATTPQNHIAAAEHMRNWLRETLPEDETWQARMVSGRTSQTLWAHVMEIDLLALNKEPEKWNRNKNRKKTA